MFINSQSCVIIGVLFTLLMIFMTTSQQSAVPVQARQDVNLHDEAKVERTQDNSLMEKKIERLSLSLTDLWCKFQQLTYTGGFCLTENQVYMGGNNMWDLGLCRALESLIGDKSIGDLGAGLGPYGRCFLRRKNPVFVMSSEEKTKEVNDHFITAIGAYIDQPKKIHSWAGFDGAGSVELLSKGFVKQRDLTEEGLWLGRKFDWVMSLEVGEHIPALYEKIYMDNLVRHACQGLVLSWAGEQQGGHHHVNGHTLEYVREKINAYGFKSDYKGEKLLRQSSSLPWFKDNLLVFRRIEPTVCTDEDP